MAVELGDVEGSPAPVDSVTRELLSVKDVVDTVGFVEVVREVESPEMIVEDAVAFVVDITGLWL